MINRHIGYYLGSKLAAAVLSLATMALFVRLGGTETFGAYLVMFAWTYVVYGLSVQWLRFAFFARYREETSSDLVVTYLKSLAASYAILVAGLAIAASFDLMPIDFAIGLGVLFIGIVTYDALYEIARTRLRAGAVAIGVLLRAALMLLFGVIALTTLKSPLALALAVGLGHLGAAFFLLVAASDKADGTYSKEAMSDLWSYGRPLIPAYALDAVGIQLDRLLLAHYRTHVELGTYGAAADFIRQVMIVIAEAIAGAYFAIARNDIVAGRQDQASHSLGQAFLAYTALTAFAATFVLRFDRWIFDTLYGSEIGAAVEPIIGLIVINNAALIFRAYFFGQIIFLTPSSSLLFYSNLASVTISTLLGFTLVPGYGMYGAAIAMMMGHIAGSAVYIWVWRGHFVMKLPYMHAATIVFAALAAYVLSGPLANAYPTSLWAAIVNLGIFGILALLVARAFDILSFNSLTAAALARFKST